ncbi:hypothetical protein TRIUR3_21600 [Triticum urartu]|uniref:Uncharacterized protein n=1 Tax=Triticum urartu TaxID=4572 RepID=M8B112_TRIUA|nr:hypothetical protein TRIUR3_21600 [Triticum urartu]
MAVGRWVLPGVPWTEHRRTLSSDGRRAQDIVAPSNASDISPLLRTPTPLLPAWSARVARVVVTTTRTGVASMSVQILEPDLQCTPLPVQAFEPAAQAQHFAPLVPAVIN